MHLIYLSSTNGYKIGDYRSVVRVELVNCKDNIIRFYRFKNYSQETAKLIALTRFLDELSLTEEHYQKMDVMVCLDSLLLGEDKQYAIEGKFNETKSAKAWEGLMERLLKFRVFPTIKDSGIMAIAARDDLNVYMAKMESAQSNLSVSGK